MPEGRLGEGLGGEVGGKENCDQTEKKIID